MTKFISTIVFIIVASQYVLSQVWAGSLSSTAQVQSETVEGIPENVITLIDNQVATPHAITSANEIAYLSELTARDLKLVRNAYYAAKGYVFGTYWLAQYFRATKWYSPKTRNLSDIHLNSMELQNIRLLTQLETNAFPEDAEFKLFAAFPDLASISAARRINANGQSYWLVSLTPKEMPNRYSQEYYSIKYKLTQAAVDSVLRLSKDPTSDFARMRDSDVIKWAFWAQEQMFYAGSSWIEVLKVTNGYCTPLHKVGLDRHDDFLPPGAPGSFQIYRSDGKATVDYGDEISDTTCLRTFWQTEQDSPRFRFIQGRCCCASDCYLELWQCRISEDQVQAESVTKLP